MNSSVLDAVSKAVGDNNCVVALGGGADSAVLLSAAVDALDPERVNAVFVYHGLEGSDELRESATAVAQACGVPCQVIERIVDDGGNLEARARAARYDAIEAMVPSGTVALTGHTADDQAETVLMRLLRGSGAGAISGIPYRRGIWRRPLLNESRASLRAIAHDLGLPFSDDPANLDPRFMRSRIRHVVLPTIEATCGPRSKDRILRSSMLLAADDAVLENAASDIQVLQTGGAVSIPTGPLVASNLPVASRVVRRALRTILVGYPGSAADVDAVLSVAAGGEAVSISSALTVTHEPPFVTIHTNAGEQAPDELEIDAGDSFDWSGDTYLTYVVGRPPPSVPGGRFTVLRAAAIGDTLGLRGVRPGDKIAIATGSTPVKEVLRRAGVPARVRSHSLVVTVDAKIAALVGVRVASWARPNRGDPVVVIEREVGSWN